MTIIYKITNIKNNKCYIGKTTQNLHKRFLQHIYDSKRLYSKDRLLCNAIREYGQENFIIEPIENCNDILANEREIFWINKLECCQKGYNFALGGDGKRTINRQRVVKLYNDGNNIKQISIIINADEGAISNILQENGITHEQIKMRSDNNKKQSVVQIDKNSKEVIQVFNSIQDAYNYLGKVHSGHIASVCNGERATAYGYKWEYITSYKEEKL